MVFLPCRGTSQVPKRVVEPADPKLEEQSSTAGVRLAWLRKLGCVVTSASLDYSVEFL